MEDIKIVALTTISMAAVLSDLRTGKIPNDLIFTGLLLGGIYQILANQLIGILLFLGGMLLPVLVFGIFYYFRMIGAGDIKLFCVAGGFLGPTAVLQCIFAAIICGSVIAIYRMIKYQNFILRMIHVMNYIQLYMQDRTWSPYMPTVPEEAKFCFSFPIMVGVVFYLAGGRL